LRNKIKNILIIFLFLLTAGALFFYLNKDKKSYKKLDTAKVIKNSRIPANSNDLDLDQEEILAELEEPFEDQGSIVEDSNTDDFSIDDLVNDKADGAPIDEELGSTTSDFYGEEGTETTDRIDLIKEDIAETSETSLSEEKSIGQVEELEQTKEFIASNSDTSSDEEGTTIVDSSTEVDTIIDDSSTEVETIVEDTRLEQVQNKVVKEYKTQKIAQKEPNLKVLPEEKMISKTTKVKVAGLVAAPRSKTEEVFNVYEQANKHPVQLKWSEVADAEYYEIEITNLDRDHRYYFKRLQNKFNIMVYPNESYKWRVLAYDNNKKPMSYYSRQHPLTVIAPTDGNESVIGSEEAPEETNYVEEEPVEEDVTSYIEDDQEEIDGYSVVNSDEPTSTYIDEDQLPDVTSTATEESKPEVVKPLWSRFWAWLGGGVSVSRYSQETERQTELTHTSAKLPHITGEAGVMLTKKIGVAGSFGVSPGRLAEESNLFDSDYTWTSFSLEGLYLFGKDWEESFKSSWYLRFGANRHSIPILVILPTSNTLELSENDQINLGLGVGKKTQHGSKISSHFYLNGQIPVSSSAKGFNYDLDSGFVFTGFLGLNYQLNERFNLGAYWQGKLLLSDYVISDDFDAINGSQFLLNNNLGLYLGFEY